MNQVLRSIYYDVHNPAGFSSKEKLYEAASDLMPEITRADVDEWLSREHVYTLHKTSRRFFPRNPVVSHGKGEHCQSDLVDMQQFVSWNEGYRYILTLIDVFSKEARAIPLKTKTMGEVAKALEGILMDFPCCHLWTDKGGEYNNSEVSKMLSKHHIQLHLTHNTQIKCSVAERFNLTLKTRMFRYFTAKNTRKYIDVLDPLIDAYNRSYHRSIKMRPIDVTSENTGQVFKQLYGFANERQMIEWGSEESAKFSVDDIVRVRYYLPHMEKSYFPRYSDQTYKIHAVTADYPRPMYRLADWEDKILLRKYYSDELQKVSTDTSYRIQRVIKRRGNQVLVKWHGYPNRANSWISKNTLLDNDPMSWQA